MDPGCGDCGDVFRSRSLELVWLNVILKPLPLIALWYLVSRWSRFAKIIGVGFDFRRLVMSLEYPLTSLYLDWGHF